MNSPFLGRPVSAATTLAALAASAALTACGGGGGDAGGSPGALAITGDNAVATARAGMAGLGAGNAVANLGDGLVGPTAQQRVVDQARRAQSLAAKARGATKQATTALPIPCSGGGTVTVGLSDSNNNQDLDAVGESITFSANQCKEGTDVMNGAFALAITQYTDADNFAFSLTFNSFTESSTSLGTSLSLNGDLTASLSAGNAVKVSSSAFTVTDKGATGSHGFAVLGYAVAITSNGSQVSETLAGTFSGTELAGKSIQISTPSPLVALSGNAYPSQGSLLMTGANNSALKIDALNATQARLSVDADGDGSYETVTTVNWSELG